MGLSADVLFDSMDALTATQDHRRRSPELRRSPLAIAFRGVLAPSARADGAACPGRGSQMRERHHGTAGTVTVTKQQNVGPYETVQLQSTSAGALNNWLAQNGFSIPADVTPVIDQYVTEGFDFLAMKLLPNQGVQAMRPVRVTMQGASLSLPLRMAAIGTGATVGITIWVVSDGRYEPQNFPFFHIEDSQLVWDWSTQSSNYTTLRSQDEASLGGKGWEIESSIDLNEQLITSVILSGGQYYGNGGGGGLARGAPPADAGEDFIPVGKPDDAGAEDGDDGDGGGASETAEEVRADDIAALFAGMTGPSVRVTRIRSDISHEAMTADFVLKASGDQPELAQRSCNVTQSVGLSVPHLRQLRRRRVRHAGAGREASVNANGGGGRCVASAPATPGSRDEPRRALGGVVALVTTRLARRPRAAPVAKKK